MCKIQVYNIQSATCIYNLQVCVRIIIYSVKTAQGPQEQRLAPGVHRSVLLAKPRSAWFFSPRLCSGGGAMTPLEAPGTYACFPDNNETLWPLPSLTLFSSELFREHSMFSQLKERAWRGGGLALERAHCAGTNYSPLQRSWGAGAARPLLDGGGRGPCRGWEGFWIHLIRSEEWLMIHKRSLPAEVDKLPTSLQQSWRTYLVGKFSLNQRFYGFYFVA